MKNAQTTISKEQILQSFDFMHKLRILEGEAAALYSIKKILGFLHSYEGQEAIAGAFKLVFKEGKDSTVTSYRCHGHALALDLSPKDILAELTGRAAGTNGGRGGSMHIFDTEKGLFGGQGIVGATFPLGAGLAFSHKYLNDGGVSFSFIGDGGANQGQVYEAFNMASLWSLPVVFIIEDNQYAMGTSTVRHTSNTDFSSRGKPWKIKTFKAKGLSIFDTYPVLAEATDYARSGKGPVLIDFETYRFRGHSMSDPGLYRTKEELKSMKTSHDAVKSLRQHILDEGLLSEEKLVAQEKENKKIMAEAKKYALEAPFPEVDTLFDHLLLPSSV